jgi:hypothetical protein
MKHLLIILLFLATLVSCDVPIELDLQQTPPQVTIEALLTDKPDQPFVRVTLSTDFYSEDGADGVPDAVVTLKNDAGESVAFHHYNGANTDSVGYYLPPDGFAGQIGRIYTLSVAAAGKTFEATDSLKYVTSIDSLAYRPNIYAVQDPPSDGKIYELLIYAKEPQETKDYYLVKYYRNDSLTYGWETEVYVLDDYGVGESIDGVPSAIWYGMNDKAEIEMYSLTRQGFLFYNDLVIIMNSDGGMFSPPPANPRTNFNNGALGFFQVSAVSSRTIVLKE